MTEWEMLFWVAVINAVVGLLSRWWSHLEHKEADRKLTANHQTLNLLLRNGDDQKNGH